MRKRLLAKARRVRHEGFRQVRGIEDFIPVDIGDRDFGGWNQEEVVGRPVHVRFELRQLPGARQGGPVDQVGRQDLAISVFAGVKVEHEIGERADQLRPKSHEEGESRSGNLGAPRQVEKPERGA